VLRKLRASLGADLTRTLGNAGFKAMSVPIEKACRILVVIVAAPALGETSFGIYQFTTTLTALFALCADLGLSLWTTRALARDRARASAIVGLGLHIRAFSGALYVLAILSAILVSGGGALRRSFVLFGAAALASTFVDYLGAIFRGFERFNDEAWLAISRAVLITAAALVALHLQRSLTAFGSGVLLGTLGSLACGVGILRRRYDLAGAASRGFDRSLARQAASEAAPMWLATLLSLLYFKIDVVILRSFVGDAELGAYSAAFKIFEALTILPSVVTAAAFSPLTRAHGNRDQQRRWEWGLSSVLLVLGCLVGGLLLLSSERVVALLFGASFARATASLEILSLGVPVMFLNAGLWQFLIARNLEVRNLVLSALLLLLNVGMNLVLIPRLRAPGAAWATVLSEVAHAGLAVAAIRWSSPNDRPLQRN
jgi:O-antigen/teichoic acid export membrane protein